MTTDRAFTLLSLRLLLALLLIILRGAPSAMGAGGEAGAGTDEPEEASAEPEVRRESPGEHPFWSAVLLLSSSDGEKQKAGREKLLEAGDLEFPPAQSYLGECYLRGQDGFPHNDRKAAAWFRLASERGDTIAKVYLGTCYLIGQGLPKDRAKARELLTEAVAAAGTYAAPTPPAWFLEEQKAAAGKPDPDAAGPVALGAQASPWEILLARGHFTLGLIREEDGDLAGALELFDAAANWGAGGRAGVYEAMLRSARARALGRGCARDLAKANDLLDRSRELLRANAMAGFHSMWTQRKVDDFALADLEKATGQFADAQLEQEQQNLADSLLKDSPAEARRWCEASAEAGEVWAMLGLGDILRLGRAGPADPPAAFGWYSRAKESATSWVAIANLVVCHKRGLGTPVDAAAASALVDKYGDRNFACMLAGAGLAPAGTWGAADWWALLDTQARNAKLPLARYLAARRDFERYMANPQAKDAPRPKEVLKAMRRAVQDGFGGAHYYVAELLRLGWGGPPDKAKVEAEMEAGARQGDLHCMLVHAITLSERGSNLNLRDAIELNRRIIAREPDFADAYNNLAIGIAELGKRGTTVDGIQDMEAESIRYLEKAEELGSAVAAKNLAIRYVLGHGVAKDLRTAYTYYQSAAEKGDRESNRILGEMHEKGIGVAVTPREAMYYYRIAALDGDFEALKTVCDFYLTGRGVERDLEAAKGWLIRLAGMGHTNSYVKFGDVLMAQKEYVEARKFWLSVNESWINYIAGVANDRLAHIYGEGLGVKPNPRLAARYHKKAVELQNADAICSDCREMIVAGKTPEAIKTLERLSGRSSEALFLLGSVRLAGQGVPKDVPAGLKNLRDASEKGHLESKYLLAVATSRKMEGAPTPDEAAQLLDEAEAAGFDKARQLRPKIESMRGRPAPAPAQDGGRTGSG